MTDEFKKYMNPYNLRCKLITAATLVMLGFFLGIMVRERQFATAPLVMFGICFWVSLRPYFAARAFFQRLQALNSNAIEQDFARAVPLVKGRVRLGQEYIFSKGFGAVVSYRDVVQVYQYIHKISGIEDDRMLKYVDTNGIHKPLCPLLVKGRSDEDMKQILNIIRQKNPDVQFNC